MWTPSCSHNHGASHEAERKLEEYMQGLWPPDLQQAGYTESTREMSDFERASTHKANTRIWLSTCPVSRLCVAKANIRIQQRHQKELLKLSGPLWEAQQVKLVMQGQPRTYRCLIMLQCTLVNASLRRYGELLTSAHAWAFLPPQYQTHSIAATAFRCSSTSACSQYTLEKLKCTGYPAKQFSPTLPDPEEAIRMTSDVLQDFQGRPCTMDASAHAHCELLPSLHRMMSARSVAMLTLLAQQSESDNASVEAGNAYIRRRVKKCLQQKTPDLTDIVADWVGKWSRSERDSLCGISSDSGSSDSSESVMDGGGGGAARGYCSMMKGEHKDERGRVNLAACSRAYKRELAENPGSDLLKAAAEKGAVARLAKRARHRNKDCSWKVSNFATQHPQVEKTIRHQA